jgi:ADP-heptose:LPS heptosyltransferase
MSPAAQKLYAFALARYFDGVRLVRRRPVVLFFRDGGIGDILCTLPAAAALADRHRDAYKIYCTHPAFISLPAMLGRFDRVLGIKCSDLVAAASRRHTVYRFRYPDEEPGASSKNYLADEFSTAFGLAAGLPWPKLDTGPVSEKVNALFSISGGRPTVCIHTGPTWAVREWPREYWAELVARLQARLGCRVLHIGASRHFREGERKEPPVKGAEDCRDIYTLMETMQIVARCRLLVGIDSGMIHAAVASGLPVVGVFGPTSTSLRLPPRENAIGLAADVPCLGCHHRHPRLHWQSGCPHDIRCMKGLTVERVFEKSAQVLAG